MSIDMFGNDLTKTDSFGTPRATFVTTNNRAEGEQEHSELEYIETRYGAEIGVGNLRLRAHWQGLADIEDNRSLFQFIVKACNEHHQLCSALTKASELGLGYQKRIEQLEQIIRDQMSVLRDWRGADNVPQGVRDAIAIRLTELRRVVEGEQARKTNLAIDKT